VGLRDRKWIVPGVAGTVVGALLATLAIWLWPDAPDSDGLEPGELRILAGADESPGRWREALVDLWNAEHPRSPAKLVELNQAADAQRSQMVNDAKADSDTDVYLLDVPMLAEFADPPGEDPYIQPLDQSLLPPDFLDGFLAKPLESCRYQDPDKLWALPFNTDAGLLFYRSDLVKEPPAVWDQVVPTAQQVAPEMSAYVTQLRDYEGLAVNALEAIWAEGGEVTDGDTVIATADMMSRGIRRLIPTGPGAMHPGARGFDETTSSEAFAGGEAVFMRNWPVQYSKLLSNDDVAKAKRVEFEVTALPGPSVLGGQNLAIASDSEQPLAAQAFVQFMTQESSQLLLARYGGFASTRERPYQDEVTRERYPYLPALRTAIDQAKLRPVTPYYERFTAVFRAVVTETMDNGGQPPADFANRLTAALRGR
jgi:multiple sugar transport system substrate-binding protein